MISRIVLAGLAAACAIGLLFSSIPASARAGGSAGGFHGGFRGGFHRGFRAPVFRAARPAFGHFPARAFRTGHFRGRRFAQTQFWPFFGWSDPYYFDPYYYYPSDYAVADQGPSADPPSAPSARPRERVLVYQPGCRTQTQTVQAESGGERTVNVTRCY